MTYPLLYFTDGCGERISGPRRDTRGNLNVTGKILGVEIVTEAFVAITALVAGILGVFSLIAMHAALAYSLIGVSVAIMATWTLSALISRGDVFTKIPMIFCNCSQGKQNYKLINDDGL